MENAVKSEATRRAKTLSDWVLNRFDLELRRYSHSLRPKRARLFAEAGINLVLDVGANTGQYAKILRNEGYRGRIVSFEPLPCAFARLEREAARDPSWECRGLALGETDGSATINIASNSVSSSVLPMMESHRGAAPDAAYVGSYTVPMAQLDSMSPAILSEHDRVHLKLDVQGYEMQVLEGARSTLPQIATIEAEMSLVPLYEGQALMPGIIDFLQTAGFRLVWLERGFLDPRTGYMLQLDGLFLSRQDCAL